VNDVIRLAMWSGPRNISTALMRAWENRPDSIVVDEPLYAHYLAVTGVDHPAREQVIARGETDWRVVVDSLLARVADGIAVFYQKHMAHHLTEDIDRSWITQLTNVLLIRDPREVVASYLRSRETVTADDIGLPQQIRLYDELAAAGRTPPVIDSGDFLRQPAPYLRALCKENGLPFTSRMLHWPAGPRDTDGLWAPYWYDAVLRSTGFEPYRLREVTLEGQAAEVAASCQPMYEHLQTVRWAL
jgi:Sulfotransferase domain